MSGDGNHHDISFAAEQLPDALAAFLAGAEIVRPDEKDAVGFRRIGIHANYGYPLLDGGIDGIPESFWICGGDQDSRSVLRDRLLKGGHLIANGEVRRARELGFDTQLLGGVFQACRRFLPIRQTRVEGNKNVAFLLLVVRCLTGRQESG